MRSQDRTLACSHMSTLHVQTKFYSWLTLTWHLRFPSSTLTAGMQQWIRVGGELFTRPLLPSPLLPRPYRKGLGTKLHDLYFDLDCWLLLAQGTQQTVLQLFLRYLVEIYKCTNASELIRPGIHTRFFIISDKLEVLSDAINVTNQIFIMKHSPVAPGWRVSRTSVAMCTCTGVGHNLCNPNGLLLSFMSTYEFWCIGTLVKLYWIP